MKFSRYASYAGLCALFLLGTRGLYAQEPLPTNILANGDFETLDAQKNP